MPFDCLSGANRLSRLALTAGAATVPAPAVAASAAMNAPIRLVTDRGATASQSNWPR